MAPSQPAKQNLLAQAAERSSQLAAQLRADAASLGSREVVKSAAEARACAAAAERLAQILAASDK